MNDRLSGRETEVLRLMGYGKSCKQIAERLGLSVKTVTEGSIILLCCAQHLITHTLTVLISHLLHCCCGNNNEYSVAVAVSVEYAVEASSDRDALQV